MPIDMLQFRNMAESGEARFRVDGEHIVSGKQCFLGRLISIVTGTRQAENKAIYQSFASVLKTEFGELGSDVLLSIKANDRSRLCAATIKQVMDDAQSVKAEYARLKIPYNRKTAIGRYMDSNLVGEMKKIGNGKFNEVFRGEYKQPDGSVISGVFKAEAEKRRGWVAEKTGIDKDNPQFGCRNVATYVLNQMLGLHVIPPAQFALHQGKLGIVMGLAPGTSSKRSHFQFEITPDVAGGRFSQLAANKKTLAGYSKEVLAKIALSKGLKKLEFDGERLMATGDVYVAIDYTDKNLLKKLNDLQWFDAFCGNGDRHPENYLIRVNSKGETVEVTGIDNDQSFGKALVDPNGIQHGDDDASNGFRSCPMPDVISLETAEAFLSLDSKALGEALSGLLTDEEITACQIRLVAIQKHIRDDQKVTRIDVMSDWDLFNGKLSNFRDRGSYVARDRGRDPVSICFAYKDVVPKK